MTGTTIPGASAAGRVDGLSGRSSYRANYRANYRVRFCSQNGPRPRQHWVLACLLSPTTRPPRRNGLGEVRVVGLSSACGSVQTGAGPARQGSVRGEELHNKKQLEDKKQENSNDGMGGEGDLRVGRRPGVEDVCGLREVASWGGV